MKKYSYLALAATAILCACDPVEESGSYNPVAVSADVMNNDGFLTFTQADADGNPQQDGNYISYVTHPSTTVSVYTMNGDEMNLLAVGATGSFKIAPPRGSNPEQEVFFRVPNADRSFTVTSRKLTVFVKQDLDPEIKVIASNSGKKTWIWDNSGNPCWGNAGYSGFATGGASSITGGQWWGITQDGIAEQTENYGYAYAEDGEGASMIFTEDGTYTKSSGGKGTYTVDVKNTSDLGGYGEGSTMGRLITTGNGILFNQRINAGDHADLPSTIHEFDIAYMSPGHLVLIAPSYFAASDGASWQEGTFWRFENHDDVEGILTDNSSKTWTWDDSGNGCWGNAGYSGFATGGASSITGGQWWGIQPNEVAGQIENASYPSADGEGATMTFSADGSVTKSSGGKGSWSFDLNTNDLGGYNEGKTMGHLRVDGDGILFNQRINPGDHPDLPSRITEFDIAYISEENLVLIAPSYFAASEGASWQEGTMWRFIPAAK